MGSFFAGLDWASQLHAVCVIDAQGSVHERLKVAHSAFGLADLLAVSSWRCPPAPLKGPSGLIVDTLVEVVPIHQTPSDCWR